MDPRFVQQGGLMRHSRFILLTALFLAPGLVSWGCDPGEREEQEGGEKSEGNGLVAEVPGQECISGLRWVGGDEESSRMHPGGDCIGCHTDRGEGPRYAVAGTIYEALDEPSDCFGFEGATVEITDADGKLFSMTANPAGNFYLSSGDGPLAMPYRAAVVMDGVRREMASPQSDGNCANCHTAQGDLGAPGRVLVP